MTKKRRSSFGVVFWIALIVFLTLLYVANRVNFHQLVGESGLPEIVKNLFGGDYRGSPSTAREEPGSTSPEETRGGRLRRPAPVPEEKTVEIRPGEVAAPAPESSQPPAAPKSEAPRPETQTTPTKPPAPPAARTAEEIPRTRDGRIYFVRLTDDGKVSLAPVVRRMDAGESPLTTTIRVLLGGPSAEEAKEGIATLIPPGSRLISATIRDGVAYLNFDESFRFNSYGIEGYRGQIRQIVYSTTEFPSIRAVQFLIEGGTVNYLSPEGLFIGKPLGRDSL